MTVRFSLIPTLVAAALAVLMVGCARPPAQDSVPDKPAAAPANTETAAAPETVADAKGLYETKCAKCHELTKASSEPGDQAHWDGLVKEMQARKPEWISDEEATQIAAYCAETYPKK